MTLRKIAVVWILAMLLGMMVPGFALESKISVVTSVTAANGDAETLTLPNPGAVAGTLLLAQITFEKGLEALPIAAPEGWKEILVTSAYVGGGSKDIGQALYCKVAAQNEPAQYRWTFSQKVKALGGLSVYEGADGTLPVLSSHGQGGYGDSTGKNQMAAPSVGGAEGGLLVSFYGIKAQAYLESPQNMRQVYQAWDLDNGYSILASQQSLDALTATGVRIAKSWTTDQLTESVESEWVAQQVVLKPAGAASGTSGGTTGGTGSTGGSPAQAPALSAGEQLKVWKLVEGDPYGQLNEDKYLTRSEMMVIFSRMMGEFNEAYAYKGTSKFTDGTGHWAYAYVSYGQYRGWTTGMGNNQFGYDLPHRVREAAVFMLKALGYKADVDFTWSDAYEKAKALGLFEGVSAQPGDNILRGDLFKVMVRALTTAGKDSQQLLGEKLKVF